MKLAEVLVVLVVGSVEDERLFSHMNCIKVEERNLLDHEFSGSPERSCAYVDHDTFPFKDALKACRAEKPRRERLSKKWLMGQNRTNYTVQIASMKRPKVAC
jgi:hypothetical protein